MGISLVNVGLLGAVGVEKEDILRLFIHYVDAGLITQIDPDIHCTIIKAQIAGKIIIDSPKRVQKSKKKRTAKEPAGLVLHPADRIVFREDNNGKNHTLFAPGGDREQAVVKMSVITVSRISRKIIAVFDVTRELDSQFKFFTDLRFFPKDIAVCLNKYDILADKDIDQANAIVNDYRGKITDFFEKRRISVTAFYPTCAETKDDCKKFNDSVINMILNITVRSQDMVINEALPEFKIKEMSRDTQIQEVSSVLTAAREILYQANSMLRADADVALEQLESSYKTFDLAEFQAQQYNLSEMASAIQTEKSQALNFRVEFKQKGEIFEVMRVAIQLLGQASDRINDNPLEAVATVNKAIQQFSTAQKITPSSFPDLLEEIKDEKEKAVLARVQYQRLFDHHAGIDSGESSFVKMDKKFDEWISRKDIQFDEWISRKIKSSLKSMDQKDPGTTDSQMSPSLTEDQIRIGALLDKIEHHLRDIIEIVMSKSFGPTWFDKCFKAEIRKELHSRWEVRHAEHSTHRIVDELTFDQYKQILAGKKGEGAKRRLQFENALKGDYKYIMGTIETVTDIRNNAYHHDWHLIEWQRDLAILDAFYATLFKVMDKIKKK